MINDRIEEGLSEKVDVSDVGSIGDIVSQIVADIPLTKIAKERIKPKRRLKSSFRSLYDWRRRFLRRTCNFRVRRM